MQAVQVGRSVCPEPYRGALQNLLSMPGKFYIVFTINALRLIHLTRNGAEPAADDLRIAASHRVAVRPPIAVPVLSFPAPRSTMPQCRKPRPLRQAKMSR